MGNCIGTNLRRQCNRCVAVGSVLRHGGDGAAERGSQFHSPERYRGWAASAEISINGFHG